MDIERCYEIPLYDSNTSEKPFQDKRITRRNDIVLKRNGDGKEKWVETKSYKTPFDPKRFTLWNFTKGKESSEDLDDGESRAIHRQFFLDRVATRTTNEDRKLGGVLQWWFLGFKRKTIEGYTGSDMRKARKALVKLPTANKKAANASLQSSRKLRLECKDKS